MLTVITLPALGKAQKILLSLPVGLQKQEVLIPDDNPLTAEKIALGKQLFFDVRWSKGQTVSCASCHNPQYGWSDPRPFSLDHTGMPTRRLAPTIINRVFSKVQGWPGHRESIEAMLEQIPFTSAEAIAQNLQSLRAYQEQFQRVFETEVTAAGVAQAIAASMRTILSENSLMTASRPVTEKPLHQQRSVGMPCSRARPSVQSAIAAPL